METLLIILESFDTLIRDKLTYLVNVTFDVMFLFFIRLHFLHDGKFSSTLLDSRTSPGYGKTGRMAGTGQGGRFSLSGRYCGVEQGTSQEQLYYSLQNHEDGFSLKK